MEKHHRGNNKLGHGFTANGSFTFQAIQKLSPHLSIYVLGVFRKFFGDLGYVWEEAVFLKGFSKFRKVRNILKLEFEIKN